MLLKPSVLAVAALSLSTSVFAQSVPVPVVDINSPPATVSPTQATSANPAAQPTLNQNAQLLMLLEQLQEEVRYLRGQVEEQAHQMNKMRTDQRDRYRDLDRRIMSLTQQLSSQPVPVPAPVTTPAEPGTAATPATSAEPATSAATPAPASATGESDKDAYSRAFKLVRDRAYQDSLQAFDEFIRFYPSSPLVPNAIFWTGEVYRAMSPQDLEAAKAAYERLIEQYPRHPKAADAHYKLGLTYAALGDKAAADKIMQKAIDLYPDQSVSRLAKEFLAK